MGVTPNVCGYTQQGVTPRAGGSGGLPLSVRSPLKEGCPMSSAGRRYLFLLFMFHMRGRCMFVQVMDVYTRYRLGHVLGLPETCQFQVGVLSALLCEWRSTDKRLAASRLCCHRVALSAIRRRMHRRSSSRQSRRATGGGGARRWTPLRKSLPFPSAFASRALCVGA